MSDAPLTVLCIPGTWKDRKALTEQIIQLSGGYLFAGVALMHTESGETFELECHGPDARMPRSFQVAGPHWLNTPEMARIPGHNMVLYLVGPGGSLKRAEAFMKAGAALIYSGGLGVKVESAGIAHSPVEWIRLSESVLNAHQAFVVYLTGEDTFSCGMHNLGLRDAIVSSKSVENPVELLRVFTRYLFMEEPKLVAGHTFGVEEGSPRFRLSLEKKQPYEGHETFFNPYGMWRLSAVKG